MRPWFRLRRQVRLHLRGKGLSARQAKPVAQLQAVDELLFDPAHTIDSLAVRDGKSERSIRMTLSLAFLSPVLAEAAMEGRLPRGFCVKRRLKRAPGSLTGEEHDYFVDGATESLAHRGPRTPALRMAARARCGRRALSSAYRMRNTSRKAPGMDAADLERQCRPHREHIAK